MNNKKLLLHSKTLTTCSSKTPGLKSSQHTSYMNKPISLKQFGLNKPPVFSKPKVLKSSCSLRKAKKNKTPENTDAEFNLLESLSIISEIQHLFESSVNENKKPIEDIKKLLTTSLTLKDYFPLNSKEKTIIEHDIIDSSDLRIENYQIAFEHIFDSLEKIKNTLNCIVEDNNKPLPKEKHKGKRVYINEEDNIIYDDDEETNFCEKIMTEKTQIFSLNSSIIYTDDDHRLLKNKSSCFLSHSVRSQPDKNIISPLSNPTSAESKFKTCSSFEYLNTFTDSLVALSKSNSNGNSTTVKKEECTIY